MKFRSEMPRKVSNNSSTFSMSVTVTCTIHRHRLPLRLRSWPSPISPIICEDLPKLTIPLTPEVDISPSRTPIAELRHPTQQLAQLKAQLNADPYHYGGVASPADIYRIDTPFSAADVPVTQHSIDPFADARNVSQSVPPELRYGAPATTMTGEPILRSASTQPSLPRRRLTKQSFAPSVTPVKEDFPYSPHASSLRPSAQSNSSSDILNHAGWMRKRRTTKMLRHEWSDNYFSLDGTQLLMLESDVPTSHQLETIDVDEYAIHAYSMATSSKLSAAFKKSILGQGYNPSSQPSFAFSLIPGPRQVKASLRERPQKPPLCCQEWRREGRVDCED